MRWRESGASLAVARVVNDPLVLAAESAKAGPAPDVVIEATYGGHWVVDLLRPQGAQRVWRARPSARTGTQQRSELDQPSTPVSGMAQGGVRAAEEDMVHPSVPVPDFR